MHAVWPPDLCVPASLAVKQHTGDGMLLSGVHAVARIVLTAPFVATIFQTALLCFLTLGVMLPLLRVVLWA